MANWKRQKQNGQRTAHIAVLPCSSPLEVLPVAKIWSGPLVVAVAAIAMFSCTYAAWPDLIVDFGRELYVPWRLAEGEVLYRDVAYFNGPLSPYANATAFRLLGTSLRTLAFVNLAVVGLVLCLLYALLARIGSRVSALLGCLFCVFVFAFSLLGVNFNYICPYSHEATHGLLAALAALFFCGRFVAAARLRDAALTGLSVGLAFLTKPEVFLAVLPATVLGIALALVIERPAAKQWFATAAAYLGAALVPFLVASAGLAAAMPLSDAIGGACGAHRWLFNPAITNQAFYRRTMGIYDLRSSVSLILSISLIYALLFAAPALLGVFVGKNGRPRMWTAAGVAVAILAGFGLLIDRIPWGDAYRPVSLIVPGMLAGVAFAWWRSDTAAERRRHILPLAMLVFAQLLLAKVLLNVRIDNYGFTLALPATVLTIVALWDWIPQAITRRGGSGLPLRAALAACLLSITGIHLAANYVALQRRTVPVGSGPDTVWWDGRGVEFNQTLNAINECLSPAGTLAVLPEGCMFNYLSRRRNPTGQISAMPIEVLMFGEEQFITALTAHPPDLVAIVNRNLQVYDLSASGSGYAETLRQWVAANYRPIAEIRSPDNQLQFTIAERVEKAASGDPNR